jgi:hypothetical protein
MRGAVIKLRTSGIETHIWIVVSAPDPKTQCVLAFNLTDVANYPASSCILEVGDHPRITMRSAVRYFSPKIWDCAVLQKRIDDGTFERFQDASEDLIAKIIAGAYEADIPDVCFQYLPVR